MDQHDLNPGGTSGSGLGGAANTPDFGTGGTATDHQIPSSTSAGQENEQLPDQLRSRAQERLNDGIRTAADGLERAARNIDDLAEDRLDDMGGRRAQVGEMAHTVADSMENVANYLRDQDIESLMRAMERQVRDRPLQTLLVGVAAGWIVGKVFR